MTVGAVAARKKPARSVRNDGWARWPPERVRCRAYGARDSFCLSFPALALRLRSGRAGWASVWRAYGARRGEATRRCRLKGRWYAMGRGHDIVPLQRQERAGQAPPLRSPKERVSRQGRDTFRPITTGNGEEKRPP